MRLSINVGLLLVLSCLLCPSTGCVSDPLWHASADGSMFDGANSDGLPDQALCGDPAVMERYADCTAADSEAHCTALGGVSWNRDFPQPCVCPTGQEGCLCTRSTQCLASCAALLDDDGDCRSLKAATCDGLSEYAFMGGCLCWFDESGTVHQFCDGC